VAKDPTVEILHITPGQAASIGWRVRVPKSPWYFGLSPSGPIANRTRVGVVITLERIRLTNVRREKGRAIQWEEDIPPGNCCSSRKQSERSGLVTVQHGASDAEGPARPDQRALRP